MHISFRVFYATNQSNQVDLLKRAVNSYRDFPGGSISARVDLFQPEKLQ